MNEETSLEGRFAKRSRPLIHALIISVALNLGLLATFMTIILKEKKVETFLQMDKTSKRAIASSPLSCSNGEILERFAESSFSTLVDELENRELLEQGYHRCDLALACLVAYHHFDLQRALPGIKLQRRLFAFSHEQKIVELIPGLDEEQFQAIKHFACFETWPLTNEGLFKEIKHRREDSPKSLKQAFFLSREFYTVERAFSRLPFVFTKETLLSLLLDGSYEQIEQIVDEIQVSPRGEIPSIGSFLAGFDQSKLAAYLLVALDPGYPYMQFSDERLGLFINFFDQKTEEAQIFLSRIVTSDRSDAMREKAEEKMLSWGDIEKIASSTEYVIQKGDSLWSLSRQFDIPIEKLREMNGLGSDLLTPGKVLIIPRF